MDAQEAAERFAALFPRVYNRFYQRVSPTAYRPSREALAVLEHLAVTGPLTIAEAAGHFGRSQSATSELIDRLERRGLVRRMPDERDRRRNLVWLTDEGQQEHRRARRVLEPDLLVEAFEHLSAEDRRILLSRLEALLNAPRSQG